MDDKTRQTADPRNEGEGNKTAARQFNQAQKQFAESGKVAGKAREAEAALEGGEAEELARSEAAGRARAAEEDPAVKKR